MPRESRLEKYIKNFVYEKTAEYVYLLLQDNIILKRVGKNEWHKKSGSTTLAIFWANVLQNTRNFPPESYPYRKHHDGASDTARLLVKADGIVFVLDMKTGTLSMQGDNLYQWFTEKFIYLLDNYDEEFKKTFGFKPTPMLDFPPPEDDSFGYPLTDTEEYLLMHTASHKTDSALEQRVKDHSEELISGIGDLSIDPDLISGSDLENDLQKLTQGSLKDSFRIVYVLWKSLLAKWFGTADTEIYMATPHLDKERIADVVKFFMQYRTNGSLGAFYVTPKCEPQTGKSLTQLQKEAAASYTPQEQTLIEYQVYRKMLCPLDKFSCSFAAGVKDGQAEVLVTSCPYHGSHFDQSTLTFVSFVRMPEEDFTQQYLKPISSPVAASLY